MTAAGGQRPTSRAMSALFIDMLVCGGTTCLVLAEGGEVGVVLVCVLGFLTAARMLRPTTRPWVRSSDARRLCLLIVLLMLVLSAIDFSTGATAVLGALSALSPIAFRRPAERERDDLDATEAS